MSVGQAFDSPNDLIVHSNGTIYFQNPTYELAAARRARPAPCFASIRRVTATVEVGGRPNGIGLSPDEKKLYVVSAGVWNLDDNGVPTTKTNEAPPNADGFSIDCAGNIVIQATNSAFGGPDGKTLLVVGGGDPPVKTRSK